VKEEGGEIPHSSSPMILKKAPVLRLETGIFSFFEPLKGDCGGVDANSHSGTKDK
jgi:hypothetical protein